LLPAILEKRAKAWFVEGFSTKLMLLEPVTQMGDQAQFLLGCGVSVPLLGKASGKPVDVGLQRAD
jgi:hypothetical protein